VLDRQPLCGATEDRNKPELARRTGW